MKAMKKFFIPILICFTTLQAFAQKQDRISGYFLLHYYKTIYDRTLGNNPSGVGISVQTMINIKSMITPMIEISAQGSLEDDDVLRLTKNGNAAPDASGIINVFAGSAFKISSHFNFSFDMGPSFINSNTYFGVSLRVIFIFQKRKE